MKVEPLNRSFGAKVYDLSLPNLNEEEVRSIYDLWLEYALLIFPQQHLTNAQQIKFAKNFGALVQAGSPSHPLWFGVFGSLFRHNQAGKNCHTATGGMEVRHYTRQTVYLFWVHLSPIFNSFTKQV